jgi:hypothetical protein
VIKNKMPTANLENSLGKHLTAKEVAVYLGLDVTVVRKHYVELGGVRIGRRYLFFENLIVKAIERKTNAILGQGQEEMAWDGAQERPSEAGDVRPQIGGERVGGRSKGASTRKVLRKNAHGVFPGSMER